jgi:hypothetical protein
VFNIYYESIIVVLNFIYKLETKYNRDNDRYGNDMRNNIILFENRDE